jgi:hypothetical protein
MFANPDTHASSVASAVLLGTSRAGLASVLIPVGSGC